MQVRKRKRFASGDLEYCFDEVDESPCPYPKKRDKKLMLDDKLNWKSP